MGIFLPLFPVFYSDYIIYHLLNMATVFAHYKMIPGGIILHVSVSMSAKIQKSWYLFKSYQLLCFLLSFNFRICHLMLFNDQSAYLLLFGYNIKGANKIYPGCMFVFEVQYFATGTRRGNCGCLYYLANTVY